MMKKKLIIPAIILSLIPILFVIAQQIPEVEGAETGIKEVEKEQKKELKQIKIDNKETETGIKKVEKEQKKELKQFEIDNKVAVSSIEAVEVAIELEQLNMKVVIDFEYPKKLAKLNTDYNNNLKPEIDIISNNFGSEYNSFSHEVVLDVTDMGENVTSGNTMYQIYPKIIINGSNSTKTVDEFNMEFNSTIALIRIAIIDFLSANEASEVSTHIHFTFGSFDFDEGF